jgi:transcriptional regulator with XRE-family HTH domain
MQLISAGDNEKAQKEEISLANRELGKLIEILLTQKGWSKRKLAMMSDISESYIRRLLSGKQVGSPESLISVARALGIRPGLLLDTLADYEDTESVIATNNNTIVLPLYLSSKQISDIKLVVDTIVQNMGTEEKYNMGRKDSDVTRAVREGHEQINQRAWEAEQQRQLDAGNQMDLPLDQQQQQPQSSRTVKQSKKTTNK